MIRVGLGFDVHRLVLGRKLILGGVEIPWTAGLAGHSDADVLVHALMDALLGAAGLPDIGQQFPPSEERFRDISSLELLARVRELVHRSGFQLVNVDAVVVAEQPRIGPHIDLMRRRIASVLGVQPGAIGIKATTNEGLGPEGAGEAMSAHAIALLESAE